MPDLTGATTSTAFDTSIYTTILADSIIHELRPAQFMRPTFRMGRAGDSKSFDFQLFDSKPNIVLDETDIEDMTGEEGQSFTLREIDSDASRVTAAVFGTMAAVTDLAQAVSTLDVRAEVSGVLSRTLAEKWETDATANLAGFSNTTQPSGGATDPLDYDTILAAIAALEQRDVTTEYVGGFHPQSLGEVRADLASRNFSGIWARDNGPDDYQEHARENWPAIAGVAMHASSTVSDNGTQFQGAVYANQEALGYLEIWGPKVEPWRDPRSLLTYVIVSQCYGSTEIDDVRGQTVLSGT